MGPNPTPNELKHFDEEYTLYLETQRRDAVAAATAERRQLDQKARAARMHPYRVAGLTFLRE